MPSQTAQTETMRFTGEERRTQIAKVCAEIIARKGYSGTHIREIAETVGVSLGTVLHHFRNKEELLEATLNYVSGDLHASVRQATAGVSDSRLALRRFVQAALDSPRHDISWRVWIAFWHEATLNHALSRVVASRNEAWEAHIESIVIEGVARGELLCEDSVAASADFNALLDGVVIHRYGEPERWTHERATGVLDRLIASWMSAATPTPARTMSLTGGRLE